MSALFPCCLRSAVPAGNSPSGGVIHPRRLVLEKTGGRSDKSRPGPQGRENAGVARRRLVPLGGCGRIRGFEEMRRLPGATVELRHGARKISELLALRELLELFARQKPEPLVLVLHAASVLLIWTSRHFSLRRVHPSIQ